MAIFIKNSIIREHEYTYILIHQRWYQHDRSQERSQDGCRNRGATEERRREGRCT